MSVTDKSENKSTVSKSGGSEKYVIPFVIAALVGLGAYQLFFCPNCYATADRTAVHSTVEP